MKVILSFLFLLITSTAYAQSFSGNSWSWVPSGSGNYTFTPLHTYYMASATGPIPGNDSNSGTDPNHPWATPNHSVVCGDVIIAAAGDYSSTNVTDNWGTVSNCPSSSGGIDGSGGIYFAVLLCGGSDLTACHSSGNLWAINQHYWAIEGFQVTNTGTGSANRAFNSDGCNGFVLHHSAFVNNVVISAASGFHTDDCGGPTTQTAGNDYWAAVGNIAQNASQNSSFCEAAIDAVGPGTFDNAAGTHIFIWGNFTWNDQAPGCVASYDSEAMMFDSWDARPYNNTGVIGNNVAWHAMRYCIQVIPTGSATSAPTMRWYNNTCYGNLTNIGGDSTDGEINISLGKSWAITITNNIAQSLAADTAHYALVNGGGANSGVVIGGSGTQNVFKSAATGCANPPNCDAGNNVVAFNGNGYGTNTYADPGFKNTSDLITNHLGAPSCTVINVVLCMGYNAQTKTVTSLSVIDDLTPNSSYSTKGYQLPSITCAPNADYPTWLKGIVYLRVVGAQIIETAGLVNKPCGM